MSGKVLLTGELGFIGSHLSRALTLTGATVFPFSKDLTRYTEVMSRIEEIGPVDTILHLGAISHPNDCQKNPDLAFQVNVGGTFNLIQALLKTRSHARFIFASTAYVYAPATQSVTISEAHPVEPQNLYAQTKRAAELLLEEYARLSHVPVSVIRIFNHSHFTQPPVYFLTSLYQGLLEMKQGKQTQVRVGNLNLNRDIGSLPDLLAGIQALIKQTPSQNGFETYNLCSGQGRNLKALANLLSRRLGIPDPKFTVDPQRVRKGEPETVVGLNDKFRTHTGWKPADLTDADLIEAFLAPI